MNYRQGQYGINKEYIQMCEKIAKLNGGNTIKAITTTITKIITGHQLNWTVWTEKQKESMTKVNSKIM